MINLIHQIDKKFFDKDQDDVIANQLFIMSKIYDNFRNASTFPLNRDEEAAKFQFNQFKIELTKQLIDWNYFFYAFEAMLLTINEKFEFRDIFYQFFVQMDLKKQVKQKSLYSFVR